MTSSINEPPAKMNPERLARCLANTYHLYLRPTPDSYLQFEELSAKEQEVWINLSNYLIKSILGEHFHWTLEYLGYPSEKKPEA